MDLVIVESPYAGKTPDDVEGREENIAYARACMADCLRRGEAPYASHLLYTQPGVLCDEIPEERTAGINAGLAFKDAIARTIVYTDRGISRGMQLGIDRALSLGHTVEYRSLSPQVLGKLDETWEKRKVPFTVPTAVDFLADVLRAREGSGS